MGRGALTLALAAAACAPVTSRSSAPALSLERVLARGALAYAVAVAADDTIVSVEVETDVQLVIRRAGADPRRLRLGPPDFDAVDLAVAPGGHAVHVASADGTVRTVDLDAARVTATWHLGDAVTAVAASPDGALLAAGGRSGLFCLRRIADGALLQCVAAHRAAVSGLDFDAASRRLASSSWDGHVTVWSLPALAVLADLDTAGSANRVAFAPDGARLAIATSAAPPRVTGRPPPAAPASVLLWRPVRGAAARPMAGHTGPVTSVAWTGAGGLLSGSWDRTVRLWDIRRHREVARLGGFAEMVRDVAAGAGSSAAAAAAAWGPGDGPAITLLGLGHPP